MLNKIISQNEKDYRYIRDVLDGHYVNFITIHKVLHDDKWSRGWPEIKKIQRSIWDRIKVCRELLKLYEK